MDSVRKTQLKRFGKFGAIGIINTLIDFGLLNVLHTVFGLSATVANIPSATVAMIFSFFANKRLVFNNDNKHWAGQALKFFLITAISVYGIQEVLLLVFTQVWLWPADFAYQIVTWLRLSGVFSHDFVTLNLAKLAAISIGLVWNYVLYAKVVFKK